MNEKRIKLYYQTKFAEFGVHPKSLGWNKGKQNIRFFELTKHFDLTASKTLIDVGCGFGDFNGYLRQRDYRLNKYIGVDIIPEFITAAREKWSGQGVEFIEGDYLQIPSLNADYIIGSGIFGHRLFDDDKDQYEFIRQTFKKSFSEAEIGISYDFLSDKTDYTTGSGDFHFSPSVILDMAYTFSRNVILDNSCMPFEFSVTLFKDASFRRESIVFNKFHKDHEDKFQQGIF
ncbi:MAG: class I SAM-dependent methyltransferase [Bdellovibrionales bacterium]|nr:class I SAM-dependent methyltransferase [Bdellovibrionales bacterium]